MASIFQIEKVVVVGCGGVGGWLVPPLAKLLGSVGYRKDLVLVDADRVEEKNIVRQNFLDGDVGDYKCEVMAEIVQGTTSINCYGIPQYLGAGNVSDIIVPGTVVLSGPDNHVCRRVIFDRCTDLGPSLAIVGGNEKFDGNVMTLLHNTRLVGPHIRERHPEIWTTQDGDRSELSCEALAKLPGGEQTLPVNFWAAGVMLSMMSIALYNNTALPLECYFDAKRHIASTVSR